MLKHCTITFIGGGQMATALINGLIKAGVSSTNIRVTEPSHDKRRDLIDRYAVAAFPDNCAAVPGSDIVILAVKPALIASVLPEIAPHLAKETVLISIAAGIPLARLTELAPPRQPIVRVMPNTPSLIGAGISALCPVAGISPTALALAKAVMEAVGEVIILPNEAMMDGVTALSASGPAYVFLIAEALSDGGVACGLPRDLADRLTLQTLMGSAKLVADSGRHPGELKNQVTSPAGTTIAGLMKLEQAGVRGALIAAVVAACQRARELQSGR
ncbi:MAG: pyrroline-5-carboxylate reductase [Magnetococcales bacterium]|nr:pyrroline-5-carboxylate reductase [Magnetococcales bacterium]